MKFQLGLNGTVQGVGIWRRLIGTKEVKVTLLTVHMTKGTEAGWQTVADLLDVQRIDPTTLGVARVEGRLSAKIVGE